MRALILTALLAVGCDEIAARFPGPWSTPETEQARAQKCYRDSAAWKQKGAEYPNSKAAWGFDSTCDGIWAHADQLARERQQKHEDDCRGKGLHFVGMIGDQIECRPAE